MASYNVLDVSRYVIEYSNEKGYGISNLKLQKILYFIQAYFLINKEEPCFLEKIEAWDFGPVVPKAYREYKQYGSSNIPTMKSFIDFDDENIWRTERRLYEDNMISKEDKLLINAVIDRFAQFSATDLVTLTHNQDPWKDAYEPHKNKEITAKMIKEYFNEQ